MKIDADDVPPSVRESLAGKRKLGLKHNAKLARFFGVKQAVFLDD